MMVLKLSVSVVVLGIGCNFAAAEFDDTGSVQLLQRNKQRKHKSKQAGEEKVIYVIRHGEKTYNPAHPETATVACLSQMGWGRAYNLVSIFGKNPRAGVRTPDAIFSAQYQPDNCRDEHGWYRTQQTVSAVAQHLNITVDNSTSFLAKFCNVSLWVNGGTCHPYDAFTQDWKLAACCNPWAADKMKAKLLEPNVKTILVAWEHVNIQWLAEALAAPEDVQSRVEGESWPGNNYDKVYRFAYDCSDTGCIFKHLQTSLSQEFVWLGPTAGCGFSNSTGDDSLDAPVPSYEDWHCIKQSSCQQCS